MFAEFFNPTIFLENQSFPISPWEIDCENREPFKRIFKLGELDLSKLIIAIIRQFQNQGHWGPIKIRSLLENDEILYEEFETLTQNPNEFSKLLVVDYSGICHATDIFVYYCHHIAGVERTNSSEFTTWGEPPDSETGKQEAENGSDLD